MIYIYTHIIYILLNSKEHILIIRSVYIYMENPPMLFMGKIHYFYGNFPQSTHRGTAKCFQKLRRRKVGIKRPPATIKEPPKTKGAKSQQKPSKHPLVI